MPRKRTLFVEGYRTVWYDEQVGIMLRSSNGETAEDVRRRAYAVQKRMKRSAPVFSGQLRKSIRVKSTRETPNGPESEIASNVPHAFYVIFGRPAIDANEGVPRGERVYAQRIRVSPASPTTGRRGKFRKRVKKAKPRTFMQDSIDAALD